MRALEFLTGHVSFKLRYNQIYQLKTTIKRKKSWMYPTFFSFLASKLFGGKVQICCMYVEDKYINVSSTGPPLLRFKKYI